MEKLTTVARLFPGLALTAFALSTFLSHTFLDSNGRRLGVVLSAVNLLLTWACLEYFKGPSEARARARAVDFTRQPRAGAAAVAKQLHR